MTPEAQRIAIAEACGWKRGVTFESSFANPATDIARDCWLRPDGTPERKLPDYLNDLNAMHEAEKLFDAGDIMDPNSLRYRYSDHIYRIVPHEQQPFRATAAQRAEAFLKAKGLWV